MNRRREGEFISRGQPWQRPHETQARQGAVSSQGQRQQPAWHGPSSWHSQSPGPGPEQRSTQTTKPSQHAHPARRQQPYPRGHYVPPPPPRPPAQFPAERRREGPGCAAVLLISVLVFVILFFVVVGGMLATYLAIAADLPSPEALRGQSASFVSTRIYDRNGHLLHEILDPTGGRRIIVPLNQISPHLINAKVSLKIVPTTTKPFTFASSANNKRSCFSRQQAPSSSGDITMGTFPPNPNDAEDEALSLIHI